MMESNPATILIVEDNTDLALTEKAFLRKAGYDSEAVCTALEGIDALQKWKIAGVVADWNLAGHTSADLIEEAYRRDIPVLAVSGNPDQVESWRDRDASTKIRENPFRILTKPVDGFALLKEIAVLVQ